MTLRTLITTALVAAALVVPSIATPQALADPPPSGGVSGSKPYHLYTHGFLSTPTVGYRVTDRGPVRRIGGDPVAGLGVWPKTASPDGKNLLVASGVPSVLRNYAIDAVGRLRLLQTTPLPAVPVGLEFAPDSKTFYLTMGVTNSVVQPYRLTAAGAARPIGRAVALGDPLDGRRRSQSRPTVDTCSSVAICGTSSCGSTFGLMEPSVASASASPPDPGRSSR